MKRLRKTILTAALGLGSMLFQGCPVSGIIDDCFGSNTISSSEFDDLNIIERQFYKENNCGRYEPASDFANLFVRQR